jgi:hypothetical protein
VQHQLCRSAFRPALTTLAVAVVLTTLLPGRPVVAASPDSAPPLPAPTGTIVTVANDAQLQSAVGSVASGTTIMIAPGTYQLSSTLYFNRAVSDVVIRGASNNRNDVVLVGQGMANANYGGVPFGIWTGAGVLRLTIANLTIRDVYLHPIIFNAGTEQPRVYNVRLADAGEQFLKANPDGGGGGVDGGIVEYSVFEYTTFARSDYTNGVDVHTGANWIIRHNLFRRIRVAQGLAGPAVLMWNSSRDSIVDGNTFVDCHREISLGLIPRTPNDHTGGVIRNNMIARSAGAGGDVAIAVFDSPGTRVVHNTIWMGGAYPNAIEYRFPDTTGVTVANNLSDVGALAREGGAGSVSGNVWTAPAAFFAAPGTGDLHLRATAAAAIDKVTATADAANDWDAQSRPSGAAADVGADEFVSVNGEVCGDLIDNDGDGQIDENCAPTHPSTPGAPVSLSGAVDGTTVALTWLAPIAGAGVDGYLLEVGFAPGSTIASLPLGAGTQVSLPRVTAGTYVLRVRATGEGGAGAPSNEITIIVGGCASAPSAPTALTSRLNGGFMTLAWHDDGGCQGRRFRLLVGSRSGAADLGSLVVAGSPFSTVVPPGQYFVRVVTETTRGTSAPSNEVVISGGGVCRAPAFAVALSGASVGGRLDLHWQPTSAEAAEAADAATPLEYAIEAGRTSGAADLGVFPMGRTTNLSTPLAAGLYYLRVRATSACGAGPASNEVAVTVR